MDAFLFLIAARLLDPIAWLAIGITVWQSNRRAYWLTAIALYVYVAECVLVGAHVTHYFGEGIIYGVVAYFLIAGCIWFIKSGIKYTEKIDDDERMARGAEFKDSGSRHSKDDQ